MSETLLHCIENLKEITTGQGKQIATLTANMDNAVKKLDELREDIKEVFIKLDGQNVRLNTVENWQENFDKNETDKLRKLGLIIGAVNVVSVLVSFFLGRII